eukprot:scaffold47467_cov12-Tisochrysis_lutea.AAC.1
MQQGVNADKAITPALGGLGLPGPGQRKEGLLPQGKEGAPTLDDLRAGASASLQPQRLSL